MHVDLHAFLARLAGTVALTLVPVILIAFVSMPLTLERHPGEPPVNASPAHAHMT